MLTLPSFLPNSPHSFLTGSFSKIMSFALLDELAFWLGSFSFFTDAAPRPRPRAKRSFGSLTFSDGSVAFSDSRLNSDLVARSVDEFGVG